MGTWQGKMRPKPNQNPTGQSPNTVALFPPSGKNSGILWALLDLDCFTSPVLTEEYIVSLELTLVAVTSAFLSLLTFQDHGSSKILASPRHLRFYLHGFINGLSGTSWREVNPILHYTTVLGFRGFLELQCKPT